MSELKLTYENVCLRPAMSEYTSILWFRRTYNTLALLLAYTAF